MVQIIPRNQPTFGERVSAGLTQGIDRGSQYAGMAMENAMQQKSKLADMQRKKEFAEQIMNDPALEGLPLATRKLLANEAAGLTSAQATKATLNSLREVASDERLGSILGGNGSEGLSQNQSSDSPTMEENEGLDMPSRSPQRNYEGEIQKWQKILADRDPRNRDFAKAKIEEIRRLQDLEFKKGQAGDKKTAALRAETMPIRKEIAEKANAATQGIQNKKQLLEVVRSGNIDDPTYAIIAQALPLRLGERMLSRESVQYRGGIIDEFKDLRTIFQGQTRMKEIDLLEDKVAGLYLTDEQKEALLNSRINALQADVIKGEVAAELEEEGDFGGALQFQKKVNERSKSRMKDLFNMVLDEQKSIIQNAENKKKIPLNANDPDDIEIIDQILEEAGGNWREAEKLAKKRGYKFNA